jgi:dTDP-4-dehydrorhamnose 3,5-epimerase
MKVEPAAIPDVLRIEADVFRDERGFFSETWHAQRFRDAGLDLAFVQDNHSHSVRNVLRGLHYQVERPQGKLVRVVAGEIFDVAVDLRRSSPWYGRWVGELLSADNRRQLWIPPGFAHGFYVTSAMADVVYKCTTVYAPALERTLRWDDPALAIKWPLGASPPLVSAKDAAGLALDAAPVFA